jgi:hypothetical protein
VRRSTTLLALLLLLPAAACGGGDDGDDDAATSTTAAPTTEAPETETETETETEEEQAEGTATPDAYAADVCGSIGGWYDEINTASTALVQDAGSLTEEDPSAGKDLVVTFLDDAIGFTDDLIVDLEAAGVPDTESGEETAERLVAGIGDVRALFSGARDDTAALPADDPQAVAAGLQDIGTALQESATAVGANFQEVLGSIEDPELSEAFETAAPCQELSEAS